MALEKMNRELRFGSLEEALDELDRLDREGVVTLGIWSYYQILRHLADHINFSISGYPFMRSKFIREKIGPTLFRQMVASGHMPSGFRTLTPETTRLDGDAHAEMLRLKNEIRRFMSHKGNYAEHPLFGKLSGDEWGVLHSYHMANHLGFVIPESLLRQKKASAKKGAKKKIQSASKNRSTPPAKKKAIRPPGAKVHPKKTVKSRKIK